MDASIKQLPDEVIEFILSKCPVKSVIRFKCVSKSWKSMISDVCFFRALQSKLAEKQNKFCILAWPYRLGNLLYLIRLEEDGKFQRESVLGYPSEEYVPVYSCNGLILLKGVPNKYMLWNPLIRKHIMIPANTPETHPEAFRNWPDTGRHPWLHHMYFDSITDDFKIVFVYEKCYKVYSCKNGNWGEVKDKPHYLNVLAYEACVDGCFYSRINGEIVFFDVRDGELHKLPMPNDAEGFVECKLKEVSGRLCLCVLSGDLRWFSLWVMETNGSLVKYWRTLISIKVEGSEGVGLCGFSPVCLSNEDLVVLSSCIPKDKNGNCTYLCNPREYSVEEIDFAWERNTDYFSYWESLYMPSPNVLV